MFDGRRSSAARMRRACFCAAVMPRGWLDANMHPLHAEHGGDRAESFVGGRMSGGKGECDDDENHSV